MRALEPRQAASPVFAVDGGSGCSFRAPDAEFRTSGFRLSSLSSIAHSSLFVRASGVVGSSGQTQCRSLIERESGARRNGKVHGFTRPHTNLHTLFTHTPEVTRRRAHTCPLHGARNRTQRHQEKASLKNCGLFWHVKMFLVLISRAGTDCLGSLTRSGHLCASSGGRSWCYHANEM